MELEEPFAGQVAGGYSDGCGIVRVERPIDPDPAIAVCAAGEVDEASTQPPGRGAERDRW